MADGSTELQLVPSEIPDALKVFTTPVADDGTHPAIDPILSHVRAYIDQFKPNLETKAGRENIASVAYRVSRAKGTLEKVGKRLADEQKKVPKLIDATRRHIEEKLDAWRDEVRAPLDAWEAAEKVRLGRIQDTLAALHLAAGAASTLEPSAMLRERLNGALAVTLSEEAFGELLGDVAAAKELAVTALEPAIAAAEKREAEALELERLRAEAAAREVEAEAERAKQAAAAREAAAAQMAAQAERERATAELQAAKDAAERSERERQAAVAEAERKAVEAAQRAKAEAEAAALAREQEAQRAKEEAETLAADRARNLEHRRHINATALKALVDNGIDEAVGKAVLSLIATGHVPAVSIQY